MIAAIPKHSFTFNGTHHNVYHVNIGQGLPKHEHSFPHLTVCHSGSCIIRKNNKQLTVTKETTAVYLLENEWHEIEALEDGTVFENIFSVTNV